MYGLYKNIMAILLSNNIIIVYAGIFVIIYLKNNCNTNIYS